MTARSGGAALPAVGSPAAWVLAARPATLPVAVAPVLVGAAAASREGAIRWAPVAAALAGALLIQVGTNLANDLFDAERGADDEQRIGPTRAVQAGLLSPGAVRSGMGIAFGLAFLAGAYLAKAAGWEIVPIGLLSVASGIAYTGGPYPLGYNGLGDLFVFVFFGLVAVMGSAFVACGSVPAGAAVAAVAVGALATNVLVVNNVRDVEGDRRAGKRTLVARFGRRFGVVEYAALLVLAAASIVVLSLRVAPSAFLALGPLAWGVGLWRTLATRADGPALNACLARSAALMLFVSGVLAAALAWGDR